MLRIDSWRTACKADLEMRNDEKSPEFDEGRTQVGVLFYSTRPGALAD